MLVLGTRHCMAPVKRPVKLYKCMFDSLFSHEINFEHSIQWLSQQARTSFICMHADIQSVQKMTAGKNCLAFTFYSFNVFFLFFFIRLLNSWPPSLSMQPHLEPLNNSHHCRDLICPQYELWVTSTKLSTVPAGSDLCVWLSEDDCVCLTCSSPWLTNTKRERERGQEQL